MDQFKTRYVFSRETRAVFTTVARNMSSLIKNETFVTCFIDETCFYLGVRNALRETMIEIVHSEHGLKPPHEVV